MCWAKCKSLLNFCLQWLHLYTPFFALVTCFQMTWLRSSSVTSVPGGNPSGMTSEEFTRGVLGVVLSASSTSCSSSSSSLYEGSIPLRFLGGVMKLSREMSSLLKRRRGGCVCFGWGLNTDSGEDCGCLTGVFRAVGGGGIVN